MYNCRYIWSDELVKKIYSYWCILFSQIDALYKCRRYRYYNSDTSLVVKAKYQNAFYRMDRHDQDEVLKNKYNLYRNQKILPIDMSITGIDICDLPNCLK